MSANGEKPHVADVAKPAAEVRATHQFSLRGLLWFAVLCSLWCSQIPILRCAELTSRGLEFPPSAATLTSVFLAWAVLPSFCFRQKFYGIFLGYLLAPLIGLCLLLLRGGETTELWQHFAGIVWEANLVCFPGTVIAVTWRWLDTPADYVGSTRYRKK
jgi:hypothetical protein